MTTDNHKVLPDIPHPFNERDKNWDPVWVPHEQIARTICECRMFELSWTLRQKPNWYEKIRDPAIIAKWRKEALDQQLKEGKEWRLTQNMVDYVLKELEIYAELRDSETGIEHACDDSIFWSRNLTPQDLTSALRKEVSKLEDVPDDKKDWHPGSNQQVLDLVHPSLYPIVYGRTYVRDTKYPTKTMLIRPSSSMSNNGDDDDKDDEDDGERDDEDDEDDDEDSDDPAFEWFRSKKFCWLPSDFYIAQDGSAKLVSPYINNIHPSSTTFMDTITSIISHFVPMWERVIGSIDESDGPARNDNEFVQRLPDADNCIWSNDNMNDRIYNDEWDEDEYSEWPGADQEERRMSWLRWRITPRAGEETEPRPLKPGSVNQEISEPLEGSGDIVQESSSDDEEESDRDDEGYYEQDIQLPDARPPSEFKSAVKAAWRVADLRDMTLQVIVKLANIELTPDNPEYAGGSWHVEGMLNERIVSTGIYYYDSDNITDSHLAFRCCIHPPDYHQQGDSLCMEWLYDITRDEQLTQTRGRVTTNQGTCLAFPNVYQHCVSPFKLTDPTQPGHRKILALFLVDPTHPIPSATTIPLQRRDWVSEQLHDITMNEKESYIGRLPAELKDLIIENTDGLMSWEEAVKVREELMHERKNFVAEYDGEVVSVGFNMCEH